MRHFTSIYNLAEKELLRKVEGRSGLEISEVVSFDSETMVPISLRDIYRISLTVLALISELFFVSDHHNFHPPVPDPNAMTNR